MARRALRLIDAAGGHRDLSTHPLSPLLSPRSIAFVGASPRPDSLGNDMLQMIARSGFNGAIYPINPNYPVIDGRRCYPGFAELPEPVDLAVLGVANARLEGALKEAIEHHARAAVIFASGYLENDRTPPLTERIAAMARAADMPICGGNGMGFYNDASAVWAVGFANLREPRPGNITFISHAGSVFGAFAHNDPRFRFNLAISAGQELVTTAADYLDYALEMDSTRVVGLFLETVRAPARFTAALAKAAERDIPVVVLKTGRTEASAALALSHSGAIAGNDAAYQALFDRYGVTRVDTLDELAATLLLFAEGRPAATGGLAVIQDSGGERELVIDLAAAHDVPFAKIGTATVARLSERLEFGLEPVNPLDAWGTGKDFVDIFADCFSALIDDPDAGLGIFFNDLRDGFYVHGGFAEAALRAHRRTSKPVAYATNFSAVRHDKIALRLSEAGVPVLDGTVPALQAARHLFARRDFRAREPDAIPTPKPKRDWRARLARDALGEHDALALLGDYGVPTLPTRIVLTEDAAVTAARETGFPAACKTAMPDIHHKTERRGVKLGLADEAAVRAAYADLAARLGPRVLVTRMAEPGVELALGLINDPQFGPVVMVGAGGVLVELLRDARYGLAPFGPKTARRLLDGLRVRPLLDGVRGAPSADIDAAADAVARFSVLAADLADAIGECDVNPLIVGPRGAVAADALIVARKA
ncbi:MAG TPA: acetate--CoA ligase family protein [Stellaceae bacterium]|nr:acetate--CoA ligase family protein [Stellaceae bacterium]